MKQILCIFVIFCYISHSAAVQAKPLAAPADLPLDMLLEGKQYQVLTLEEYQAYKARHPNIQEYIYEGEVKPEDIPLLIAKSKKNSNQNNSGKSNNASKATADYPNNTTRSWGGGGVFDGAGFGESSGSAGAGIMIIILALAVIVVSIFYVSMVLSNMNNKEVKKEKGFQLYQGSEFYNYQPSDADLAADPSLKPESGYLNALLGITYLPSLKRSSFGAALEAGYLSGTFMQEKETDTESGIIQISGNYLVFGGVVNVVTPYGQLFFSLLSGKSENPQVKLLMLARMGFLFGDEDGFQMGATIGALGLSLDTDAGFVRQGQPINMVLGLRMGYSFR